MFLASMWACHESELRADMQRVYGINLDHVKSGAVSVRQAAALCACLPAGSLCLAAEDARLAWSKEQLLVLAVVNAVRGAVGASPIDPYSERSSSMGAVAMSVEDLDALLSKKRREVSGDAII